MKFFALILSIILVYFSPVFAAVDVNFAGQTYSIPSEAGETGWETDLTNYLQALGLYTLQTSGGTQSLTGDLNLGGSFGVEALYYQPHTGTPASTGVLRLAENSTIAFRNEANTGDVVIAKDVSDRITVDGEYLLTGDNSVVVSNKTIDGTNTFTSPVLSGATLTNTTLNSMVTGTAVVSSISTSTTTIPQTSAVKNYVDAEISTVDGNLSTHIGLTAVHGATGAVVGTTNTQVLTNKTLTSPILNTGVSGTAILDEDDMLSNSATQLATQQSIKAYVDNAVVSVGSGIAVTSKTANYTATASDDLILCDATAGDVTITLPATPVTGDVIAVEKIDAAFLNDCIVNGNGKAIEGFGSLNLEYRFQTVGFAFNGSTWNRLYNHIPPTDWDDKELTADVSADGTMTDLTFTNVKPFSNYRLSGQIHFVQDSGSSDGDCSVIFSDQINVRIGTVRMRVNETTDTVEDTYIIPFSFLFNSGGLATSFIATASGTSAGCKIMGNSSREETFMVLEELPNHRKSSKF